MDEEHPTSGSSPPSDFTGCAAAAAGLKCPRPEARMDEPCEGSRQGQRTHGCRQGPQQPTTTSPAAPAPAGLVAVNTSCSHPDDHHPLDPDARMRSQLPTLSGDTPPALPVTYMAAIAAAAVAGAASASEQPEAREHASQLLSRESEEIGGGVGCSAVEGVSVVAAATVAVLEGGRTGVVQKCQVRLQI